MFSLAGLKQRPRQLAHDRLQANEIDRKRVADFAARGELGRIKQFAELYLSCGPSDHGRWNAFNVGRIAYGIAQEEPSEALLDIAKDIFVAVRRQTSSDALNVCIGLCNEHQKRFVESYEALNRGRNAMHAPAGAAILASVNARSRTIRLGRLPPMPTEVVVTETHERFGPPTTFTMRTRTE